MDEGCSANDSVSIDQFRGWLRAETEEELGEFVGEYDQK